MTNTDNLWQAYAENKSPADKENLIVHYAPIVKHIAGRLVIHVGHHIEIDDLIGYGVFGLIDAIEKFDYTKGVKFETYATIRIRGTIMDYIRKMDWIPRTKRDKSKQMEQVFSKLEEELERAPSDEEIAEKLGMSVEETRELIKKSTLLSLVSLDDFMEQNYESSFASLTANPADAPEEQFERQERKDMLVAAIKQLEEKERQIVSLYYFEDLTVREISSIMKISGSRVSQLHCRAITKLQTKLGRYKNLLFM